MKANICVLVRIPGELVTQLGVVKVTARLDRKLSPRGDCVDLMVHEEGKLATAVAELSPAAARWVGDQLITAAHAIDGGVAEVMGADADLREGLRRVAIDLERIEAQTAQLIMAHDAAVLAVQERAQRVERLYDEAVAAAAARGQSS